MAGIEASVLNSYNLFMRILVLLLYGHIINRLTRKPPPPISDIYCFYAGGGLTHNFTFADSPLNHAIRTYCRARRRNKC